MSKRHVRYLLGIYEAVLADYLVVFPSDRKEVERDLSRLTSLAEERGLPFLTVDLVDAGKHFDKCLSDGAYNPSGLAGHRPYRRGTTIPRIFREMLLRVFDECGMLRQDPDVFAVATIRQLYAVGKKLRLDCRKEKVNETISDFFRIEAALPMPDMQWATGTMDLHGLDSCHFDNYHSQLGTLFSHDERSGSQDAVELPDHTSDREPNGVLRPSQQLLDTCQQVADIVSTTLGLFEPQEWMPKHGPGAVSETSKGAYKYDFQHWPEKLEPIFPYATFAHANEAIWADACASRRTAKSAEVPSRLICVPKTQRGPRLIAAEPTANQWCQQTLWAFMEHKVASTWMNRFIRFRDQTFNQEGARLSSLNGSWTVDLSAASDRLSLRFVERLFRRNPPLLCALRSCRTTTLEQRISPKFQRYIELKKFSTMGSACTFPVQTLAFLTLALAATCFSRGLRPSERAFKRMGGEIRIFGDDIIIPADGGIVLDTLLPWFSFKANENKTHRSGYFRESCGLDVYQGYCVTPAYVLSVPDSRSPESVVSAVNVANNFFRRGWWRTAEAVRSTIATEMKIPVVAIGSGSFGHESYTGTDCSTLVVRRNDSLQRLEARVATVCTKAPKLPAEGYGPLLQYFTERPAMDLPWSSGHVSRATVKIRSRWVELAQLGISMPELGKPCDALV